MAVARQEPEPRVSRRRRRQRIDNNRRRNGDYQGLRGAAPIVERGDACAVVGNPDRAGRRGSDAPGILQVRIGDICHRGKVRNQVGLGVAGAGARRSCRPDHSSEQRGGEKQLTSWSHFLPPVCRDAIDCA